MVITEKVNLSATPEEAASPGDSDALHLSPEDIEAAYMRALAAVDAVEQAVPELAGAPETQQSDHNASPRNRTACDEPVSTALPGSSESQPQDAREHDGTLDDEHRGHVLHPRQIVEAALFVGGEPLTAKRLMRVLGHEAGPEAVEQLIAEWNEAYDQQARPYEIRLSEGGYQLSLRSEFEDVRDRVYGRNPRDVTLSQDALEVLALVAYQQPVRCADLEAAGKTNAASVLRQLLRRQLVSLQRDADNPADVTYTTTARFLEVFGLRSLADLPLPDDLAFK